jgi:hypothetical protein
LREVRRATSWIPPGLVAAACAVALVDHLNFALTTDGLQDKDWFIHFLNAVRVHGFGIHWGRILAWYDRFGTFIHMAPLTYLVSSAFLVWEIPGPLAAMYAAKAAWIVLLVASLYAGGKRAGGTAWAGLAAAAVGGLSGAVLDQARAVNLEFPTLAAVALALAAGLNSGGFERLGRSLAAGACCGIAALTKPTTLTFVAPFFLAIALAPPDGSDAPLLRRARNLAAAALAALAVAGVFYVPLARRFLAETAIHVAREPGLVARNLRVYGAYLCPGLISPVLALIAAASAAIGLARRDRFLLAIGAAGLAAFGFLLTQRFESITYAYPFQALAALLIARGIGGLRASARAPAALLLAAFLLWPLAAPERIARAPWVERPPRALRLLYPSESERFPLGVVALPRPAALWADLWPLARLFSTRYAGMRYDDIAVAGNCGEWTNALLDALVLSRPDEPWERRSEVVFALRDPTRRGDLPAFFAGFAEKPLWVVAVPRSGRWGPPNSIAPPDDARLMAEIDRLARRRRLDWSSPLHTFGDNDCDVRFYRPGPPR